MAVPSLREQAELLLRFVDEPDFFSAFRRNPAKTLADYDFDPSFIRTIHRKFQTIQDVESQLDTLSDLLDAGTKGMPPIGLPKMDDGKLEEIKRIVNTGFVSDFNPLEPLKSSRTLGINQIYHFWFDIRNEPLPESIELTPTSLPPDLPGDAELDVVLFEFPSQAKLIIGSAHGKIKLDGNAAKVLEPADAPEKLLSNIQLKLQRLFFKIKTPDAPGKYQLRNNIYFQGNLLQSRLITFHVTKNERNRHNALTSELDFTLSKSFSPQQLTNMNQNHLSVFLNDDGNGTHGLRLFGKNNFIGNATLGDDAIKSLINTSRQQLRRAAWGKKEPYNRKEHQYRYGNGLNIERLSLDLKRMALRGYEFYSSIIISFAGSAQKSYELADMMRKPGQVQIASKETIQMVIPAAMIYDHPLDDSYTDPHRYSICPEFLKNLKVDIPLGDTKCFKGECPSHGEDTIICPSGFWGFRHYIGLPVSIKSAPDAPTAISTPSTPEMSVSVSTDPQFIQRANHEKALQAMRIGWAYADSRSESLELLKHNKAQIVYYYCHGGVVNGRPYIKVGPNDDGERLTPGNLLSKRILFDDVRPLVFINGCHTTALTPDNGFDMVSAFIQTSQAAGVIGTEITIFEEIAVTFAESFFTRFLLKREPVGKSVRDARLDMLKQGNPLGLVYVPYALPSLKLTN